MRENLLAGHDSTGGTSDGTLLDVLEKVGLHAELEDRAQRNYAVDQSPTGHLDTTLTANDMLTKGQQQLFALARAVLTSRHVLILDEATSALDQEKDAEVVNLIAQHFHSRTVIAIAHHLKTIMNSDRVLVMDAGRILEDGRPSELAETEGGMFREMLRASL